MFLLRKLLKLVLQLTESVRGVSPRVCQLATAGFVLLIGAAAGCQSTPAHYERELAVMRGEIIDLESKYFSLKSDYEMALADLEACRSPAPAKPGQIYHQAPPELTPELIYPKLDGELQRSEPTPAIPEDVEDPYQLEIDDGDNSGGAGRAWRTAAIPQGITAILGLDGLLPPIPRRWSG